MTAYILLLAGLAVAGNGAARSDAADEYLVIVSSDVEVDDLSVESLRQIFTFQRRFWKGGQPIRILVSEESLSDDSFLLRVIYRMDYLALRRMILEKLYQGEIDMAPFVLSSDRAVIEAVRTGHGLVALVRRPSAEGRQVKIVRVEGEEPGSPRYPLHARRWNERIPGDPS